MSLRQYGDVQIRTGPFLMIFFTAVIFIVTLVILFWLRPDFWRALIG